MELGPEITATLNSVGSLTDHLDTARAASASGDQAAFEAAVIAALEEMPASIQRHLAQSKNNWGI